MAQVVSAESVVSELTSVASVRSRKQQLKGILRTKHLMRKTFKYRLFTTRLESELLGVQLGEACRLYNAALQERREAWEQRVSINYYTQANQLKEIRAAGDLGLATFPAAKIFSAV